MSSQSFRDLKENVEIVKFADNDGVRILMEQAQSNILDILWTGRNYCAPDRERINFIAEAMFGPEVCPSFDSVKSNAFEWICEAFIRNIPLRKTVVDLGGRYTELGVELMETTLLTDTFYNHDIIEEEKGRIDATQH